MCATNRQINNASGFTLVEISIAVTLVGLLAAIAAPNFIRNRNTAQTNACINNLRAIDYSIQEWALEEKKASDTPVEFADISPYLKSSVLCPAGGTTFADSYTITVVGVQPVCQRVPESHLLPQSESEAPPPDSIPGNSGSGSGHGNGHGNGHHGKP